MEEILTCGDADFIAMCRPLINDPSFPELMRTGKKMVSDCISSNNCWPQKMGEGIACKCPKID
jgi:2,4-dienoyl-CoA reductase-like NADH-dependent reductase (Old Yellow Enzyme family)